MSNGRDTTPPDWHGHLTSDVRVCTIWKKTNDPISSTLSHVASTCCCSSHLSFHPLSHCVLKLHCLSEPASKNSSQTDAGSSSWQSLNRLVLQNIWHVDMKRSISVYQDEPPSKQVKANDKTNRAVKEKKVLFFFGGLRGLILLYRRMNVNNRVSEQKNKVIRYYFVLGSWEGFECRINWTTLPVDISPNCTALKISC